MAKALSIDHCVECKYGCVICAGPLGRRLKQQCNYPLHERLVVGCVRSGIPADCPLSDSQADRIAELKRRVARHAASN